MTRVIFQQKVPSNIFPDFTAAGECKTHSNTPILGEQGRIYSIKPIQTAHLDIIYL